MAYCPEHLNCINLSKLKYSKFNEVGTIIMPIYR